MMSSCLDLTCGLSIFVLIIVVLSLNEVKKTLERKNLILQRELESANDTIDRLSAEARKFRDGVARLKSFINSLD